MSLLLQVASLRAIAGRPCNFNTTDPSRDGRCAVFDGLTPVAVVDPNYDKMLCYWPDPGKPVASWASVQVGRAHPVNPQDWKRVYNESYMPADIRTRLSKPPFFECRSSSRCCFVGSDPLTDTVSPRQPNARSLVTADGKTTGLPRIWPGEPLHRGHMEAWCNGTELKSSGGDAANPHVGGYLHMQHMSGYCRAKALVHNLGDEVWAGPPAVMISVLLALALVCLAAVLFSWRICCCCVTCRVFASDATAGHAQLN